MDILKKRLFVIFIFLFIATAFVYAGVVNEDLHLNIQTTNATGGIVTGTYEFTFNITMNSSCNTSQILYSNVTNLTTDIRGVVSYYLENVSLNFSDQYYLCYYRNGTLQNVSKIVRNPYSFRARNVTITGIEADANFNLTSYNISTTDTGFFGWLGSLTGRITKLWVIDADISGNLIVDDNTTLDGFVALGESGVVADTNIVDVAGTITGSSSVQGIDLTPIFDVTATGTTTVSGLEVDIDNSDFYSQGNPLIVRGIDSSVLTRDTENISSAIGIYGAAGNIKLAEEEGTVDEYIGIQGYVSLATNDTVVDSYGGHFASQTTGNGITTNQYGAYATTYTSSSSTLVTNAYGLKSRIYKLGGNITNAYGLYADVDAGDSKAYGLYLTGSGSQIGGYNYGVYENMVSSDTINYFKNKVGINTTTPQNTLNVVGDFNVTGSAFFANGVSGNYSIGVCWQSFYYGLMNSTNCTAL